MAPRAGAWRVLRHRDYRLLWLGQLVSMAGTQIQVVALAWQVYALTDSPLQLGLIGLLRAAPVMILSLVGGVFADTVDRRRLLLITQGTLLSLSALLAVTTATGTITIPLIYAVIVLGGMASAFDNPARQALIPTLVPREELTSALTLNITIMHIGTIVGPTIGGLIIARGGVAAAYTADAVSFGAVIAALLLMRANVSGPLAGRPGGLGSLLEGIAFVRGNPLVLSMMLLDFFANLFGTVQSLLPIYARDILRVGPEGLGLLYAATSAGAMLGAVVLSTRGRIRAQGPALLVSVALYGLSVAAFGLSTTFWLSAFFLACSGAADTVSMVLRGSILQLATPDALRGRATSVHMAFAMGGPQLGQLRAGATANLVGPAWSAFGGGLACVAIVLAVAALAPKVRRYRL